MSDLTDLIERVERAEGPDRELDAHIAVVTGWRGAYLPSCPTYTASVDAALALVEAVLPGARWELTSTGYKPGCTIVWGPFPPDHHGGYAATPALALVLALLRAVASTQEAR